MSKKEKIIALDKEHLKNLIEQEINLNGHHCDLNHIDVSHINDMSSMFFRSPFNGNVSNWNVSNVIYMHNMFYKSLFNQDISNWDVSKVTDMNCMFYNSIFNGDISNWDIRNVKKMDEIFELSIHNNIPYWAKYETQEERVSFYITIYFCKNLTLIYLNLTNKKKK